MEEKKLVENIDYYINKDGLFVFTAKYLLERGYCCGNNCLHCPYNKGIRNKE
ncbi:MAG: DUF5522 domain-containing protein [Chitinophagales bacterium]